MVLLNDFILKNTIFAIRICFEKEGYKCKSQITNSPPLVCTVHLGHSDTSIKRLLQNPVSETLITSLVETYK